MKVVDKVCAAPNMHEPCNTHPTNRIIYALFGNIAHDNQVKRIHLLKLYIYKMIEG